MPPKRKADKGKQSQSKRSKADDEPVVEETSQDETNIANSSSSNNEKSDAGSLNDKLEKFKELRRRRVSTLFSFIGLLFDTDNVH